MRPVRETAADDFAPLLNVRLCIVAAAVHRRGDCHHAVHGNDVLAFLETAIFAIGGPADCTRAVFVFGHRDQKALADTAFVAGARRYAKAADVSEIHAHEAADAGVRLAAEAHHALTVIQIEFL